MTIFDYVDIPACAAVVPPEANNRPDTNVHTSPPPASHATDDPVSPSSAQANTPTRTVFKNLPGLLLTSLPIAIDVFNGNPRNVSQLLSTRDPLSVHTTTVNFRRFVSRVGPLFWLQDRIEEIVTWKGWKGTVMWMIAYSFLCYYPRLILLLPNILVLAIIIVAHPPRTSTESRVSITEQIRSPPTNAREGSTEWLANLQGLQNLMGLIADVHDAVLPYLLHLTFATSYTPLIFTVTLLSTLLAIPFLSLIPLRPLFLVAGLAPFALCHPLTQRTFTQLLSTLPLSSWRARLTRLIDDDKLKDRHWQSELREVELFENERWLPGEGAGWGKASLKTGERVAWTRGRDGCSAVTADGSGDVSSNLTFPLEPGWTFVETEDWRADTEAKWSEAGADDSGWVYTNDAWLEPHALPLGEWKAHGAMTRRRRWVRRIYLNPVVPAMS